MKYALNIAINKIFGHSVYFNKIEEKDLIELAKNVEMDLSLLSKKADEMIKKGIKLGVKAEKFFKDEILSCDEKRAELEKYDSKCLEDVNFGHWELWGNNLNNTVITADLSTPLIARNPVSDVHYDGIIGIDFGTKSTIVSCQNDKNKTRLLRIGIGQLSKRAELKHYENPTVMEFISLDRFMKAYNNEQGRPHTSIQDLTVSHKAYNSMKNCEQSDLFYSFFYDIKQWCGDGERYKQIKIIDQNKQEHILPKYLDIKDNEFDPVEIYAYYLGLFINNMRNGIYINYILSFPVTYEKAVKEKLLNSFTKGIKKSLPDAVLSDNNVMKKFKVRQGISEPAAYAICALKNFGLNPIGNQKIFYGIFDFGGGTTDFDFGLYRCADKDTEDRYDYVIEQFGSEGDKFLGGENLLELLSFEIFKANQHNLRYKSDEEPCYTFFKPTECDDFDGSETLISNSQEAKRNTKQLMEALRPIWEGIVDYKDKNNAQAQKNEKTSTKYYTHESGYILKNGQEIFQSGKIMVDLFDKNGKRHPGVALDIVNKSSNINVDIFGILERRIQKGANNFFEALKLSFDNRISDGQDNIHIFLAGNSSKSPILHKCFINTMKLHSDKISDGREKNPTKYFKLYYPLGTPEAIKIQKENKVAVDLNDVMMPTGKTGVAYGLIEGRTGGNIKVISSIPAGKEIRFNYYVGRAKRGAFKVILDRNIEYGKWVKFIDAGLDEFELYYSDLPESASGSYSVENMKKKIRMIDYTDDEADIYIRAVAPSKIEYSVAKSPEDAQNGKFLCDTVVIDLNG